MTPFPYSIEAAQRVGSARAMMAEHGIRHLPVTQDRELIGVLSERDLRVADRLAESWPDSPEPTVGTVCSRPPYVVEMSTALNEVVLQMAERGVGSAVVVRQGKLAGILTTTDVCRCLAELILEVSPPPGDDDVA
jgi:acetoin utilization protein AcuB